MVLLLLGISDRYDNREMLILALNRTGMREYGRGRCVGLVTQLDPTDHHTAISCFVLQATFDRRCEI